MGPSRAPGHRRLLHLGSIRRESTNPLRLCLPASAEPELLRLPLLPTSPPQPHPRISPAAAGFARSVPKRRSRGGLSARGHILNAKTNMTSHHKFSSISWKSRTTTSLAQKIGGTGAGLSLSFAVSGIANVVGPVDDGIDTTHTSESSTSCAHGKKVYTEYSVTGLLRAISIHMSLRLGSHMCGDVSQNCSWLLTFFGLSLQIRLFFATMKKYQSSKNKHHFVFRMPITVYMREEAAGGLIAIAEYGQEYGKENPIRVLYHGCGHYEALQIPGNAKLRSRL
ncbi:hypothetical protein TRIUR3_04602 [Triticum urartu]|uniref:OTU domain-containing protein n=1 Tax=Triticum urartu TaxID=4572 RepID=M7ZAD4_TRIUA|nr:hypothetical protein TRIUR3_04602 [Triticum urartu]